MNTIWIVLPILTLLIFELGLTLNISDFKLFVQRPRPVLAGLIGQIVLLPLIAFACACVFKLDGLFFVGVMLILHALLEAVRRTCSPCWQKAT